MFTILRCNRYWWLVIGGAIASAVSQILGFFGDCALAQITPDRTLGRERSVITPNVLINGKPSDQIDGGAIRGSNLFHSFSEFNVGERRGVYFTSPPGIQNILSRVTGGNASNILGTLGVSGNANLFLINPNGIIFGHSSSLEVNGSFLASTASSFKFDNATFFSTTHPGVPPLLTITAPISLQYGSNAGSLQVQGYLSVPRGQTLALVGGNLSLDGAHLQTYSGRVELAGVAGAATVGLFVDGNNLRLSFPNDVARADVSLTNGSQVIITTPSSSGVNGGNIAVNAQNLDILEGSKLEAGIRGKLSSVGIQDGSQAGDITLNATGAIKVDDSWIYNNVNIRAIGKPGKINVTTDSLSLTNGAELNADTFGQGDAGNIRITAKDTISLNGSKITSTVRTGAIGKAGDINITTGSLTVRNGAEVQTSTSGQGNAGSLTILAHDTVFLDGVASGGYSSGLFSGPRLEDSDSRQGGVITVNTPILRISNGAVLSARTRSASKGGDIFINANNVEITGGGELLTTAYSSGQAGNITVNAPKSVTISGIDPTFDARQARFGKLTVDPASRDSGIFANTDASGQGGNINITTGQLQVLHRAQVTAGSLGTGNAGDIVNITTRSLKLDNGSITTTSNSSGQGGNISNLQVKDLLLLRNQSQISTSSGTDQNGGGNGGNININAKDGVIVAVKNESNDITANAFNGSGGLVQINATGIYGLTVLSRDDLVRLFGTADLNRLQKLPTNVITSISQTSPNLNGQVNLNTPDVDPSQGLVQLPTNLFDASSQIDNSCNPGSRQRASSFVVTGRGGLPPNPRTEPLSSDAVQVDWVTLNPRSHNYNSSTLHKKTTSPIPVPIVQATGWMKNAKGEVVLTANPPSSMPFIWHPATSCRTSR